MKDLSPKRRSIEGAYLEEYSLLQAKNRGLIGVDGTYILDHIGILTYLFLFNIFVI